MVILQPDISAMNDISTREDIEKLVNTFYDRVKTDGTIGFIFHQIVGEDWSHHLPVMYSFWETVLLAVPGYMGNPVKKHIDLDNRIRLEPQHFARWLQLWEATVDELFAGEIADMAKSKGMMLLNMIKMKVEMARGGFAVL